MPHSCRSLVFGSWVRTVLMTGLLALGACGVSKQGIDDPAFQTDGDGGAQAGGTGAKAGFPGFAGTGGGGTGGVNVAGQGGGGGIAVGGMAGANTAGTGGKGGMGGNNGGGGNGNGNNMGMAGKGGVSGTGGAGGMNVAGTSGTGGMAGMAGTGGQAGMAGASGSPDGGVDTMPPPDEPGAIRCGSMTCDGTKSYCCVSSNGPACFAWNQQCPGAARQCDGPEDCAGRNEDSCCGRPSDNVEKTGFTSSCSKLSQCQTTGGGGLCHADVDCPKSLPNCCPVLSGYNATGVCRLLACGTAP